MNTEQKPYPIERVLTDADHLAQVAEQLLQALNKLAGAEAKAELEETEENTEAVEQCQSEVADFFTGVRLATHEYQKRARRYRESVAASAAAEQAQQADHVGESIPPKQNTVTLEELMADLKDGTHGDAISKAMDMAASDMALGRAIREALQPESDLLRNARHLVKGIEAKQQAEQAQQAEPVAVDPAVAAIQFALETDSDGLHFLSLWNEGEFDLLRREWPEAPEAIYIGADPLLEVPAQPPAVAVPSAVIGGIHLDMMCAGLHSDKAMADELWRVLQRHLAVAPPAAAVPDLRTVRRAQDGMPSANYAEGYDHGWNDCVYEIRAILAAAPQAAVSATDSTVGKLRLLVAACNRIEEEAEELEGPDGLQMGIAMDYWHEFGEALTTARKALAAAQKGGA